MPRLLKYKLNQKGFAPITLALFVILILAAGLTYYLLKSAPQNILKKSNQEKIEYEQRKQALESEAPKPSSLMGGSASLSNPASDYCIKVGGTLQGKIRGDGGEYNICNFEDNQSCEEWALYREDCPVGGIKTVGYDTPEEVYCAQIGGQTVAEPNANCTLPDGKVCLNSAVYQGNCQ